MAWFLFSVENNYDQPLNNLEAWWKDKPSLEVIASCLNSKWPASNDETTLTIVKIWSGEARIHDETSYRLKQLGEGILS